jgi:uncharacterized membrane protein
VGIAEDFAAALAAVLPDWLVIALIAMLPFIELRGAIPIAVLLFGWDVGFALAYCVAFNIVPGVALVFGLERMEPTLRRVKVFDRILTWVFERTRRRHAQRGERAVDERRRALLLALFVGVPLPVTGAWTGAAIAYVFGMDRRFAALGIAAGVVIAGMAIAALIWVFSISVL